MAQTIKGGPSKWDLMLAVFDGGAEHPRLVMFMVKIEDAPILRSFFVRITGVDRDDGSGESFMFRGTALDGRAVQGFYRTDRRTGVIEAK